MNIAAETPGPRLRRERERQGLSLQKAADELHLDNWVIEALETDQYARLGPAVYARGHLKKYATLLGIPSAEVVAGYEALKPDPAAGEPQKTPLRVLAGPPVFNNLPWAQIAGAALLVLVAAGVLWWAPWRERGHSAPAATAQPAGGAPSDPGDAAAPAASIASAAPGGVASAAEQGAPGDVAPKPGSSVPAAPAGIDSAQPAATPAVLATDNPSAVAGAGHARLRMRFSADSWVDVHDAVGKRIYAGNGRANSVKTIAGDGPLRVYLGFASGVQLEINDRAVAIEPQFVSRDVARFLAGADGVLRRDPHGARPRG
jgi:cytoskeleton protein RodZ